MQIREVFWSAFFKEVILLWAGPTTLEIFTSSYIHREELSSMVMHYVMLPCLEVTYISSVHILFVKHDFFLSAKEAGKCSLVVDPGGENWIGWASTTHKSQYHLYIVCFLLCLGLSVGKNSGKEITSIFHLLVYSIKWNILQVLASLTFLGEMYFQDGKVINPYSLFSFANVPYKLTKIKKCKKRI